MSAIRRTNPLGERLSAQFVLARVLSTTVGHSNNTASGGKISQPRAQGSTREIR